MSLVSKAEREPEMTKGVKETTSADDPGDREGSILFGSINPDRIRQVCLEVVKLFHEDPRKPIRLILNSGGGDVDPAIGFWEFVKHRKIPLEVDTYFSADSAAIIVLCAGQTRRATSRSTFLFHPIGRTVEGRLFRKDFVFHARDIGHVESVFSEVVGTVTKRKPRDVRRLMNRVTTLSAEDAQKFGLIHEIIEV